MNDAKGLAMTGLYLALLGAIVVIGARVIDRLSAKV